MRPAAQRSGHRSVIWLRRSALLCFAMVSVATVAYSAPDDVIELRQAGQDLLEAGFNGIGGAVVDKDDVGSLEAQARAMGRWIRQFPKQFPVGSEHGHNTRALPAIWTDPAKFAAAASKTADDADKLADLAKAEDTEGVKAQIKVIGADCRDCHRDFRGR